MQFTHAQNESYIINSLTIENGLSNNHVTSVLEDSKGFIWIATYDGLNRWNGYSFETFKKESSNPNSLSGNFLLNLAEDKKGNIWIGTNNAGLVRYNVSEEKFYRYFTDPSEETSIPGNIIRSIKIDENDNVWVGTNYGLAKFQPQNNNFKRYQFPTGMASELILDTRRIISSGIDEIIVQNSLGLFTVNIQNDLIQKLNFVIEGFEGVTFKNNEPLFYDSFGNFWIGSSVGLIKKDTLGNVEVFRNSPNDSKGISSVNISCIYEDSQRNLWVGTSNKGVNLYDRSKNRFSVFQEKTIGSNSISNNIITHIVEDSQANLWVSTQEGGLNILNKNSSPFSFYIHNHLDENSLSSNKVGSIFEDESGEIWIGTKDGGVNQFKKSSGEFKRNFVKTPLVSSSILGLESADKNSLFATGWDLGLFKFNKKTGESINLMKDANTFGKSLSPNIKGITKDSNGNVWLASHEKRGITVYDSNTGMFYNSENPGPFDPVLLGIEYAVSFLEDSKKRLWVVSYAGIYVYDSKLHAFKNIGGDISSLSSNYCFDILEDSKGNIWVGSSAGLDQIIHDGDGMRSIRWNDKLDLPINVKSILEDDNGLIWLSSNQGLTKFDPETHQIKHYRINKEIPNQEFYERSRMKSDSGELYFGGINGLLHFHPDSLFENDPDPRLYLVDFQLFNKSQKVNQEKSPLKKTVTETDFIELSHDQSVMTFEFAGLNFKPFQRLEYAYKMEGFDDQWYFVGEKRFATYTNLPPGKYNFRVQLAEGNNLLEAGTSVELFIHPPFWKTPVAYAFYLLLIIAIFYFFRKSILYREQLRNELKLEKIQIKNVTETNLMKLRFFTNVSHEFRTPLTLIKAPIEKLQSNGDLAEDEKKYHFGLIQRNAEKLLKLVDQLMDYRKMEAGSLVLETSQGDIVEFAQKTWSIFEVLAVKNNISYTFEAKIEKQIMSFDADKLDKIISNLLSNAFKNTRENGNIVLTIEKIERNENQEPYILISVKDDGVGIPKKDLKKIFDRFYSAQRNENDVTKGTGIGLALSQELAELHHGNISVVSKKGEGAIFSLMLPVKNLIQPFIEFPKPEASQVVKNNIIERVINYSIIGEKELSLPRVLVLEDDEELAAFIYNELAEKFDVILAKNGIEGLEKAVIDIPQIIISDITMPEMDGLEFCKKIKADELTSHIPVILLTARYSQDVQLEGLESGADDYIVKPFNVEVLKSRINNLLSSRKELAKKFRDSSSFKFDSDKIEDSDSKLIHSIINIVLENIEEEKINADFIAERVNMSRTLVYLKIEALTGQSVNEFVRNIRLKKSKQLLKENSRNITEIAYAVGFSSQSYFSRSFVKQFGITPKEYQQREKK
ncbi:two-component regulator propeller domain-containing protein [Belliella marina]|uniref:histidine kinase n=1 Tax=Belliella marina TaxID=1644146 RepID=A0ABW4VKG0_9BACT